MCFHIGDAIFNVVLSHTANSLLRLSSQDCTLVVRLIALMLIACIDSF